MRNHRPAVPTLALALLWLVASLVALGVTFALHPPIPDGPILRAVVTTKATR
jgi:hypothetical protein